jgi:hypothetical protein
MVMAEKSFPEMVMDDVKKLFGKSIEPEEGGKPGSELPAFGKCGCHPGGIHPEVEVVEAEQRDPVELIAIPVKVDNVVNVRTLPAKRGSMETFYPGTTAATAVLIQGADPRIRRLIIQCGPQACWFGPREAFQNFSAGGTAASAGVFQMSATSTCPPWEGIHEDLWAMAVNGGSVVSVRREYWTDI